MKFNIDRKPLAETLARIAAVVDRRTTIPVLENLLLEAGPGGLVITGTDMDVELREVVPGADIQVPGTTTAPAATLYDIARRLSDDRKVEFEIIERGDLSVRSGRSKFTLRTINPGDFPIMSAGELTHTFTLPASDIYKLIDNTSFAISTEETRYYLNGIYLHAPRAETPILRAVATDGHRLAQADVPAPDDISDMPGIIIPKQTVGYLRKMFGDAEDVTLSLSEHKIRVTVDGATLTSRLIDGTFPDYNRVIPAGNDKILEVLVEELVTLAERVTVVDTDKTRAVKLSLSNEESDGLTVSTVNPDKGAGIDVMDCKWSGAEFEIGVNSRYLLDNLKVISGETARFAFSDPGVPIVITDTNDASVLFVLMPMRV